MPSLPRRFPVLLLSLMLAFPAAQASDSTSTSSKPIKQASAKDDSASSKEKDSKDSKDGKDNKDSKDKDSKDARKSSKDSKDSKDSGKESISPDELAVRIAERLATLRKDKEDLARASQRSVARSAPYVPPARKAESPKVKGDAEHGPAAVAAALNPPNPAHWSYQGESGPQNWGKLSPANAKCDNGERQSPIDIRDGIRVDLDPIGFDYQASGFSVIDNGHTIRVNIAAGNYITVLGHRYELVQFHFHKPSEERVNGKSFEMVAHLVHQDTEGKLAVVAVLLERGKPHSLVQQVWNNLPLEKNEAQQALVAMDMNQLLPVKRDYYTYMGSLTAPPCTEGVLWLVMKEPVEISAEQLAIFSRLYPMNARPIQKTSGRLIKESN
ncbi:carbonic anhydrase [Undibacterium griseum]|nr:carbonic anhydrase family protein [Undibacterium griseum]